MTALPDSSALAFPAQPATLDDAKAYLTWVADHALRGLIGRDQAFGATKAIEAWLRVENFAREIRELRRQITALGKDAATARPHG